MEEEEEGPPHPPLASRTCRERRSHRQRQPKQQTNHNSRCVRLFGIHSTRNIQVNNQLVLSYRLLLLAIWFSDILYRHIQQMYKITRHRECRHISHVISCWFSCGCGGGLWHRHHYRCYIGRFVCACVSRWTLQTVVWSRRKVETNDGVTRRQHKLRGEL